MHARLDRIGQCPPKVQFEIDPRANRPVPNGDGIDGRSEFGHEAVQGCVHVMAGLLVRIHQESLRIMSWITLLTLHSKPYVISVTTALISQPAPTNCTPLACRAASRSWPAPSI